MRGWPLAFVFAALCWLVIVGGVLVILWTLERIGLL